MNILSIFKRKQEPKQEEVRRMPMPGEEWFLIKGDQGPWPTERTASGAIIRDVAGGWVRYRIGWSFPDCRMELNRFMSIYSRD
jgi:hypothetical protein